MPTGTICLFGAATICLFGAAWAVVMCIVACVFAVMWHRAERDRARVQSALRDMRSDRMVAEARFEWMVATKAQVIQMESGLYGVERPGVRRILGRTPEAAVTNAIRHDDANPRPHREEQ